MVKICHISTVHPLFDDRIFYKECLTLADNGYEVFLVIAHTCRETIGNVNIIPLNQPGNRFRRVFFSTFTAFRKAYSLRPDIVHFHDPELIFIGIMFRILGKKVIYDVHEDLPKQIRYKKWIGIRIVRMLLSVLAYIAEHSVSLFFNRVIAATPDIRNNFRRSKTILLRNYPRTELIKNAAPAIVKKNLPVVVYAGLLSNDRGISELLDAIELTTAELWLIGTWEDEDFMNQCRRCKGWSKTKYFGQMRLEEVYSYLKIADIGVSTLHPLKNYLTSLPVKAFEYMAAGIPMILSDFPYWKEVFQECALFADPCSSGEIAEKIRFLLGNKQICENLVSASRKAVESKFSWENESQELIILYSEI